MGRHRYLALLLAVLLISCSAFAEVQTWKIDPNHTASQFAVRHLGISTVRGQFNKTTGTVQYEPEDVSKTVIDITIDAASIDTRIEARDNDLRSPNFFDVQQFPTITFKSKRVEKAGDGQLKVTGDLTIRGTTKEVVLDVDGPTAPITDPKGNQHMGASATTKVNRKDFGVNGAPSAVADDINLTLDVELVRPAPAK